jgi:hypothetical protein
MPVRPIDPESKKLIVKLGSLHSMFSFYLSGGAAVAFHLGHRTVTALEFSTESPELDSDAIVSEISKAGSVEIRSQSRSQIALNMDGIPVRLAAHPFPLLQTPTRFSGMRIGSPLDSALDTLVAISSRGSMRDFVDLYFIVKTGYELKDIIRRVPEKYFTLSYSTYQLIRSIAWFGDADSDAPPDTNRTWKWPDVKALFQKEAKRLMARYFG